MSCWVFGRYDPGEMGIGLCICSVLTLDARPDGAYVAESVVYPCISPFHSVVTRNRTAETVGESRVSEYCCM